MYREKRRANCTLADTITDFEAHGERFIPFHIATLVGVNLEKYSEKYRRDLLSFEHPKELHPLNHIKSFVQVHETAVHHPTLLVVVFNHTCGQPRAHGGAGFWLKPKLKLVTP